MRLFLSNRFALAALALALPVCALADVSGTKTLSANTNLNLETGATSTSAGGDILWNGSALSPQGTAKAAVMPGVSFDAVNQIVLQTFLPLLGSSAALPSSSIPNGTVIAVMTTASHTAKLLVTANANGSITLQFTTYGATGGGGGGGGGPTITSVANNSSNIPTGFPNSGIAQGSLFVVKGSGLSAPADAILQDSTKTLPATLNGASVSVTVGGVTKQTVLYYAIPTQVAGVLPSSTPTGSGTLTVTYNGVASAAFPIQVVAAAPGITTYNGSGIAQHAQVTPNTLVTYTDSAKPGEIIILWGTGFGPTANSDTTYDVSGSQTSVSYTIYIGGVAANIGYKGASVYPGVGVFGVTIPANVPTGCYVPIAAVANGNVVSNTVTIPIAAGGGVCSDPLLGISGNQISTLSGQTTVKYGGVNVIQSTSPGVGSAVSTFNIAGASFLQITGSSYAGGGGTVSVGGCVITQTTTSGSGGGSTGSVTGLDAGTVTVTPPGGSALTLSGNPLLAGYYSAQLNSIPSTGGAFVFHGSGGSQVGTFNATVNFPNPILTWTNQSASATVNRSQDLTVTWDGGAPGTYVSIFGSSINLSTGASGSYTCLAPVAAKTFTVPSYVLLTLPTGTGSTSLYNYTTPAPFSASGLDYAGALGIMSISVNSNYN